MLIGFCGNAGAGKDTCSDLLVTRYGFVKVGLADPLKRICKEIYNFSDEQLWGPSEKRNAPDKRYLRTPPPKQYPHMSPECPGTDVYLTPRYALQKLGTEFGRDCYNNTWVDYALRVVNEILVPNSYDGTYSNYSQRLGLHSYLEGSDRYKGVAISDVRFRNEIDAIKAAGGYVVRLLRNATTLTGEAAQHISETEQKEIPDSAFDFLLPNHGPKEELPQHIENMFSVLRAMPRGKIE